MWSKIISELYDITSLPVLCLLVSCCIGLLFWRRQLPPMKIIIVFLLFNLTIEIGARIVGILYRNNLPLLHLYTFGECLLFSLFYRQVLDEKSVFKRYFYQVLGVTLILVVLNTIFLQGIFQFNSYAKTLVQVLIILYALDYAFRFSEEEEQHTIVNRSLRLINAAVLIYYCGSLFIFMSSTFEIETGGALQILWDINTVLNLIFQIVVLIALWKVVFHQRKLSSSSVQAS